MYWLLRISFSQIWRRHYRDHRFGWSSAGVCVFQLLSQLTHKGRDLIRLTSAAWRVNPSGSKAIGLRRITKKKFTVSTSVQTMKLSLTDETRIFFSEFLGHFFSQPPVEMHPNGMSLSLSLCFPAILVFFVFICPPSGPMRTQKKSKSLNNKMRLRQKRWNQSSGSRWKPSDGERAQKTPRIKAKRRN